MSSQSTIFALLKFYATRMNTATVNYIDFVSYVKKYAQIHVVEQPDLVNFLGNAEPNIEKELENLATSRQILITDADTKRTIFFIPAYVQKFSKIYQDIQSKTTRPFPVVSDMPKTIPLDILTRLTAQDFIKNMLQSQELNDKTLYSISFPHEIPSIIVPSNLPVSVFGDICIAKIRALLQKDEHHEYFSKKLRISNPGKEIACKNFFERFVNHSENIINDLKTSGDNFYFWTQLCYFIRQDYESIKDFTPEDVTILQAIYISEIMTTFFKDKLKNEKSKKEALENLKQALERPPYYFSMQDILNFTNSKGVLLTKLYSPDDLKRFLEIETSESEESGSAKLPKLLVFKTGSGSRYFIYKDKIVPLIIRLCNEAHDTIGQMIKDSWVQALGNFDKLPEMTNAAKYEEMLRGKTEKLSPVLYALLNANFLLMLTYELRAKNAEVQLSLFEHDKLLPYSSLLLLKQQDLLSNAKIELPFWYSIPIFSWLMSLFVRKPKKKNYDTMPSSASSFQKVLDSDNLQTSSSRSTKKISKEKKLAMKATQLERHFVQEGSTVERDMVSYLKIWNKMIDNQARINLEEDVNVLIRDYIRKVISTLNGTTFDEQRLETLAQNLCNTPGMRKIGEPEALKMYVQLYILHLLKSIS